MRPARSNSENNTDIPLAVPIPKLRGASSSPLRHGEQTGGTLQQERVRRSIPSKNKINHDELTVKNLVTQDYLSPSGEF